MSKAALKKPSKPRKLASKKAPEALKRPKLDIEIRFRGSPLDEERLEALAFAHELTPSAVMRRLIAWEYAKIDK